MLYGYDASYNKKFSLRCDKFDEHQSLERSCYGEMGFPVEPLIPEAQSALNDAETFDPMELDLDPGCPEPYLWFSTSQVKNPTYALLDSGATHVLLPR